MRGTLRSFLHQAMSHGYMTPWVARSDISTAYILIPDHPMMFSSSSSPTLRTAEPWPCPKHPTAPSCPRYPQPPLDGRFGQGCRKDALPLQPGCSPLLWPSRRAKRAISQSLFLLLVNILYFYVLGWIFLKLWVSITPMLMSLLTHVFEKEKLFPVLRGDPCVHHLEALVSRGLRKVWKALRSANIYKTCLARGFLLWQSKLI